MLASSVPTNFPIPFANSAAGAYIRTVPTASQIGIVGGAASLTDGFPPLCFSPQISGGIPPSGADLNGLLKQVTANIQWQGAGGYPQYNSTFSTAIGGYPNGAILQSADYAGYWLSQVDNNTSNPDANGANWLPINFHGSTPITMTNANVTLTLAQYSRPLIIISGTLIGSFNLIFPNIVGEWVIVNNTSGAFTITAKTAAGTGYIVPQGAVSKVYGDGTNIGNSAVSQSSADLRYLTQTNAASIYLTQANASTTYLTQASAASIYLTQANASATYLTQANAASTYLTQANAATTYAALNGNAAQAFSAATATTAAQVTRFDQVFGVGQTRQLFTSPTRQPAVSYTNSTTKPIEIIILINLPAYSGSGQIPQAGLANNVGLTILYSVVGNPSTAAATAGAINALILPSETYYLYGSAGVTVGAWYEIR